MRLIANNGKISTVNKYHKEEDDTEMGKVLSRYANTSILEFIAEAWCEYMNNPVVRPVAKQVGERLIGLYKEKF